jgi:hypothetical protein
LLTAPIREVGLTPSFEPTARGCRVVAGEHEDAYAGPLQGSDRAGSSAFDRIRNGDHSRGRSINCNEDHRRAFLAKLISFPSNGTEFNVRLAQTWPIGSSYRRFGAGLLGDRHRFTGNHRFIERAAPFNDQAVDRHGFTRTHARQVANDHGF